MNRISIAAISIASVLSWSGTLVHADSDGSEASPEVSAQVTLADGELAEDRAAGLASAGLDAIEPPGTCAIPREPMGVFERLEAQACFAAVERWMP